MKSFRIAEFLLPALLVISAFHCDAASAASLMVKIRQINPDGQAQQVTCAYKQNCVLTVAIRSAQGQNETLTVTAHLNTTAVLAKFQTDKGYLYVINEWVDKTTGYETRWHRALAQGNTSTDDVTLYLPAVPHALSAPILDAAHEAELNIAHPAVATLEITTQSMP